MTIASVTRLHLKPNASKVSVFLYGFLSWWQAKRAEGNIRARVRRISSTEYWTLSVWRDQRALDAFIADSARDSVWLKVRQWCDESSSARWSIEEEAEASWPDAVATLSLFGYTHEVAAPSEAQAAGLPLGNRGFC